MTGTKIISTYKSENLIKEEINKKLEPLYLEIDDNNIKYLWLLILLVIDFLLFWFYIFLYKKLKPLIKLKKEITKFSKGDLNTNTKVDGKDEIVEVSNEFNNAIEKIKELNDSRKLFLRNILHELKTPITKGKLISDTLENSRKKEILQKVFLRLEYLLEEFVILEELSSGKIDLIKKEYRIIDLLDQSIDIISLDKSKIKIYSNYTKVNVNFEIFSIAIKNLIDNALRYNTNGKIEIFIRENSLLIKNKGNPLKKEFQHYLKPFSREYESIDKGLGLGLYITNNVVKIHGFRLCYLYENDYHILSIKFEKEP
jgi:two-component system OmpR family sensor kinase